MKRQDIMKLGRLAKGKEYDESQHPRDESGRWTSGSMSGSLSKSEKVSEADARKGYVGVRVKDKDGIVHRVRVTKSDVIYPYKHRETKVWGEPVNKNHPKYQEQRRKMGDDYDWDMTNTWAEHVSGPHAEKILKAVKD